jgi:glucose/mannose-6-phosphate isomerase
MTVEKMMGYLYNLPQQFEKSMDMEFSFINGYQKKYRNILVSGMGGSAIGGDILKTYSLKNGSLPVIVNRDYNIPGFIDENTLFFAVSYSGNTEETLSAYRQAKDKGAAIVCITSGGKLAELASQDGYAVMKIPGGFVPRAATGYLFAPMALLLEQMGILKGVKEEIQETVQVLKKMRAKLNPDVDQPANQAKSIAKEIKNSIPVVWGAVGTSETAAMRWKGQINENAKSPAYYNVFPELNHNEIVGFEVPQEMLPGLVYIILRDTNDNDRINKRIKVTKDIIKDKINTIIEVNSQGESFLARFYSLTYIGDYASVYLAMEYGINPTPVHTIDHLKAELAK